MHSELENARLFDFIRYQMDHLPQHVAFATKVAGKWTTMSTQDVIASAERLSAGLLDLGVKAKDKVGIISTTNRSEWNVIDLAVLQIGAVDVPIYPTITEREYRFILNDSSCKVVFVSDKPLYDKIMAIKDGCPALEHVYMMDQEADVPNWKDVMHNSLKESKAMIQPLMDKVEHTALATLIYTSGTTGIPKGVMLSHQNIVSNVLGSSPRLPLEPGTKALSFLPLCHIYERMLAYLYVMKGANVYYAESMETIGDDMRDVKPELFTAVPRLLEKIYARIMAKGAALTGFKKTLFFWAIDLAEDFESEGNNGFFYEIKLKIARKLIFSKWQEALGGNVRLACCGSAALSPRLCTIYNAAGIPIMEGYGLTESSPVISVNELENDGFRIGTCGRALDNVEVMIAEDGEILARGPNVMMGYYNQPEKTAEVLDKDGWLHTGDIGELVDGQFLKITDRKKEIFKTSGGKYVAPQLMENVFKQSLLVEQMIVLGENKKHPAALIVPAFEILCEQCKEHNIDTSDTVTMLKDPKVIAMYQEAVDAGNKQFAKWEQIKKFILVPEEWTIAGGQLTPTLKLKRKAICEKYEDDIKGIWPEA